MSGTSRRRFLQGAAGGGAAVAAGAFGASRLKDDARADDGLVAWEGPRQAGIVTDRTPYGMIAAFDVVTDDLALLMRDLTARVAELTQGWPDRLDGLSDPEVPPSDTGELGYDRRRDGRLTITVGLGASLFDDRFGLAARKPPALKAMPAFPSDDLDPGRTHGDVVVLVQSDHALITHHAMRDVMRRTSGRLEGRWCQPCFQRIEEGADGRPRLSAQRGMLGYPDGSQNISPEDDPALIWAGREAPEWARGGTYLAARLIRLELERWDRLTRRGQDDAIGRRKLSGSPLEGGSEQSPPRLTARTPANAHIRKANPRTAGSARQRMLRRSFVYNDGFGRDGMLDSGSVFLAFCRDVGEQFEAVRRRMNGQELDRYAVAVGGGYFFMPPGVRGDGDYLARRLVERS